LSPRPESPPRQAPQAPLWQSRFLVPAAAVSLFLDALEQDATSVAAFEDGADASGDGSAPPWRVELLHKAEPDHAALAARLAPLAAQAGIERIDLTVAPLAATDWLARTRESFPPQPIGRFWIHGSHVSEPPPAGCLAIELDAGLAFGSGEHATTQGCLLALDLLARRRRLRRVLDLGCGSGILAIAAAKRGAARVVAADNDPVAVAVARANAARNAVGHRVRGLVSEGYRNPLLRASGPYDLILANILADPLCAMARATARHLASDGLAVLSGLLERQAERVVQAHRRHGLRLREEVPLGIWTTLVMTKRP
jgi:ribosomal protein L11 methyltransferase